MAIDFQGLLSDPAVMLGMGLLSSGAGTYGGFGQGLGQGLTAGQMLLSQMQDRELKRQQMAQTAAYQKAQMQAMQWKTEKDKQEKAQLERATGLLVPHIEQMKSVDPVRASAAAAALAAGDVTEATDLLSPTPHYVKGTTGDTEFLGAYTPGGGLNIVGNWPRATPRATPRPPMLVSLVDPEGIRSPVQAAWSSDRGFLNPSTGSPLPAEVTQGLLAVKQTEGKMEIGTRQQYGEIAREILKWPEQDQIMADMTRLIEESPESVGWTANMRGAIGGIFGQAGAVAGELGWSGAQKLLEAAAAAWTPDQWTEFTQLGGRLETSLAPLFIMDESVSRISNQDADRAKRYMGTMQESRSPAQIAEAMVNLQKIVLPGRAALEAYARTVGLPVDELLRRSKELGLQRKGTSEPEASRSAIPTIGNTGATLPRSQRLRELESDPLLFPSL